MENSIKLNCNINIEITKEIEWYIKAKLPELLNEAIFSDPETLHKIIKDTIKSQTRALVVEMLQSSEYRTKIQDKVYEQLGIRKGDN